MPPQTVPILSARRALSPSETAWWGIGTFVFLCALCLQQHLPRLYQRTLTEAQAQGWRNAPELVMHLTFGSVRLSGNVPTQQVRERLVTRAREVFGAGAVVDGLRVQSHVVPTDWVDNIVSLLWIAGNKIDNGKLSFTGPRVEVSGSVQSAEIKNVLIDNMQAVLSEHAKLDAQLTIDSRYTRLAATIARMLPPGILKFRPQSAVLTPLAKQALDRVASTLRKSNVRFEVIGYADAVAAPELSRRLSVLRADAVRSYLIERGVAPQQLRSVGAGETAVSPGLLTARRAELRVSPTQ